MFKKPTSIEVRCYADILGFPLDAENFIDFYDSKGWLVGKNKMKDWKAAIRTWFRSYKENNPNFTPKEPELTEKQKQANKEARNKLRLGQTEQEEGLF